MHQVFGELDLKVGRVGEFEKMIVAREVHEGKLVAFGGSLLLASFEAEFLIESDGCVWVGDADAGVEKFDHDVRWEAISNLSFGKFVGWRSSRELWCDTCLPDVAREKNFDGRSEGDGHKSTEEATKKERPEEDGEDDGHGVKADRVSDDLGGGDERVDLLHDQEDADNGSDVGPGVVAKPLVIGFATAKMDEGDEGGGDHTKDVSDEGEDAKDGESKADKKAIRELEDGEGNSYQDAVDEGDDDLASEEGDEVAVDFRDGRNHLVFKFRGFEGDVLMPSGLNFGRFVEKVVEVDRY